jgi:hypothetical protein
MRIETLWTEAAITARFEDLNMETIVVATNYVDRSEIGYDAGPLRPAGSISYLKTGRSSTAELLTRCPRSNI